MHYLNPSDPRPCDEELQKLPIEQRNSLLDDLRQESMGPSNSDGDRFYENWLPDYPEGGSDGKS